MSDNTMQSIHRSIDNTANAMASLCHERFGNMNSGKYSTSYSNMLTLCGVEQRLHSITVYKTMLSLGNIGYALAQVRNPSTQQRTESRFAIMPADKLRRMKQPTKSAITSAHVNVMRDESGYATASGVAEALIQIARDNLKTRPSEQYAITRKSLRHICHREKLREDIVGWSGGDYGIAYELAIRDYTLITIPKAVECPAMYAIFPSATLAKLRKPRRQLVLNAIKESAETDSHEDAIQWIGNNLSDCAKDALQYRKDDEVVGSALLKAAFLLEPTLKKELEFKNTEELGTHQYFIKVAAETIEELCLQQIADAA